MAGRDRLMALVAERQYRGQRARVNPEDPDAPPGVAETPVDGEVQLPPGDLPGGPLGVSDDLGGDAPSGDASGMAPPPTPPVPPADPAIVDEIRNVRDQVEEVQRDNQDTGELLRDLTREIRQIRLNDASPEQRDEEMDRMKDSLTDDGSPASPREFGMPGNAATRKGSIPMDLRTLRRQRIAARKTAQSDAHGEMFPTETGINLEDDHWGADVQEDEQRTTPPTPEFTDERGLEKITTDSEDQAPEWMEKESARAAKGFDLEFVADKTPFYVVSDLATQRPVAIFTRPPSLAAEKFAAFETYGKMILAVLDSEGFPSVMKRLGAKRVDEVLAARIRAARGESPRAATASARARRTAQQDSSPAAELAAPAALESVFDDPAIATAVDQYVASRDAAFERCFKMAMSAAVAGHIDNPLKGALVTLLGHVIEDPGSFCDDAFAMCADQLYSVLYRQAREWMRASPETLISIEGMITRRVRGASDMRPRFAATGRPSRETPASLSRRATEGSDVPMSVEPGAVGMGWGDGGFEEDTLVARIRHSLPVMDATRRVQRITSVPSGRFRG